MQETLELEKEFFDLKDSKDKKPQSQDGAIQDGSIHDIFNMEASIKASAAEKKNDIKTDEPAETLQGRFETDRAHWKNIILGMANKITNMAKIGELQVELYSNRQVALEHNHFLMSLLAKLQKEYKKKYGKKWDEMMNFQDRKMKMGETNVQVEAHLADHKEKIELLENQINYFQETIKNIDNIIYGLKYRINVEEFRRDNK